MNIPVGSKFTLNKKLDLNEKLRMLGFSPSNREKVIGLEFLTRIENPKISSMRKNLIWFIHPVNGGKSYVTADLIDGYESKSHHHPLTKVFK